MRITEENKYKRNLRLGCTYAICPESLIFATLISDINSKLVIGMVYSLFFQFFNQRSCYLVMPKFIKITVCKCITWFASKNYGLKNLLTYSNKLLVPEHMFLCKFVNNYHAIIPLLLVIRSPVFNGKHAYLLILLYTSFQRCFLVMVNGNFREWIYPSDFLPLLFKGR